jgi:hypothetical protein
MARLGSAFDAQGAFGGIEGSKAIENKTTRETASEERTCEIGEGAQHKGGGY